MVFFVWTGPNKRAVTAKNCAKSVKKHELSITALTQRVKGVLPKIAYTILVHKSGTFFAKEN